MRKPQIIDEPLYVKILQKYQIKRKSYRFYAGYASKTSLEDGYL